MSDEKKRETEAAEAVSDIEEEESLVVVFDKPFNWEGQTYNEIDLTPVENVSAEDMIAVDNQLKRGVSGTSFMPEITMEYALTMAARKTGKPIEFFKSLPAREAIKVRSRVTGFFYG